MAEGVLFSLATAILKSIGTEIAKPGGDYASQMIQLLCCAEGELQSLECTVETIKAVLLDAEKQQWHNNQVKLWLKRLKDVLYDVQDLLDDLATDDLRQKVTSGNDMLKEVRLFFSESNQLAHRFNVANKIRQLRKKLDRIKKDRELSLEEHRSEEPMAIGRGKKPEFLAPDTEIIGREKDKKVIIDHLFDSSSSQSVSVVSIVGKGGLGKTALARLAYSDVDVQGHFGLKMWVCVSVDFNVDSIIKEILKSAKNYLQARDDEMQKLLKDLESRPILDLPSLLRETLSSKKYLLVLDDLWNEDRCGWSNLFNWLKSGVCGSKILVTTRSQTVAEAADATICDLKGLPTDESWDLFRKNAFGDGQDPVDKRLDDIGRDIVRKCVGVPLAIRTIGSLLYKKKEDEWRRYKMHELPEIPEIDADGKGIIRVLKFSYDRLRSCLKQCFAYCSLFPKDYVYHKEMVIRLWVAQGFIETPCDKENPEVVADNYLSELLCGSFLDAATKGHDGEVLTFKMHDLMHDLARKVAGDECKILHSNEGIDGGIRHASFISKKMVSVPETSKLRTFLLLGGDGLGEESSALDYDKILSGFSHCRVLGLGKLDIPLPPSSFGKLKYLRFLDLSENQSMKSLPDSITDLLNLQTLKLSSCENLTILPRDLGKLVNLRFLDISENQSIESLPNSITDLLNLQTLKLCGCEKLPTLPRDLSKLVNLRFLDVSNNQYIKSLPDSITDLQNLQTLKLSDCKNLETLPRDLRKLVNLRHLLIDGCDSLSHMPCGLNHLSSLQTLSKFVVQRMDYEVPGGVGRVDELSGLDQLAGSITLQNLQFLRPTPYKCHFKEKERLRSLNLEWSGMQQDDISQSDELITWENLGPHPNLADLSIYSYMGRSPPSWLSSIKNLVSLVLIKCSRWRYLPPLSELHSLSEIRFMDLSELEFVQDISELEQSNTTCPFYPSLKGLCLYNCQKLKGWWGRRQSVGADWDHQQHDLQSSFPKLSIVTITYCPNLNSIPLFPQIEDFKVERVGIKLLKQQLAAISNSPSEAAASTFIPLSNLDRIHLSLELELEHSMLETTFQFLRNLGTLYLVGCKKLKSLSCGMRHLSSLRHLHIYSCEELDLSSHDDEHGTQWRSLAKLRYLRLRRLPKLMALPEGIQHVITLQSLRIEVCPNLTSLPEWIGNLSSLQDLRIEDCEGLTSLPDGMRRLTSLKKLRIIKCPVLEERCQEVTGADWEKIAHVEDLSFRHY